MFSSIRHALARPGKLREAKAFLDGWCPPGVEVVQKDDAYWLHYGGMVYSIPYTEAPEASHVQFMPKQLEDHKWCLELAGGVYTHRSLLQAWARKYLPDAIVIGYSDQDVIYAEETKDRPVYGGEHTNVAVLHNKQFVYTTKVSAPFAIVAMELRQKTEAIATGGRIYFRGNFRN